MTDKPEFDQGGEEDDREDLSISGQGWDILAGGQGSEHITAFTSEEEPKAPSPSFADAENPFASMDDAEVERLLTGTPAASSPLPTPPDDAFWDRGHGSEAAGAGVQPGDATEALPRDLAPEDLGDIGSYSNMGGESARHVPAMYESSGEEAGGKVIAPGVDMEVLIRPPLSGDSEVDPVFGGDPTLPSRPADTGPLPPAVAPMFDLDPSDPVTAGDPGGLPYTPPFPPITPDQPYAYEPKPFPVDRELRSALGPEDPLEGPDRLAVIHLEDPTRDLVSDAELTTLLVTDERILALWKEIDDLYRVAVNDVRGHYKATEHAISDLKKAREYLLAGKQYYDNAEELVMHAKAKLRLEEKVRQWSRTRGPWLVVYLIVWLMLLSASSLIIPRAEQIALDFGVPSWLAATILPGLFGGLGGVVGALWVLIKHIVIKRDFDPIHTTWYVVNPFMGITLGVMTYLIVYTGGVLGNLIVASDTNLTVTTGATPFMYALCVVVGFRQNVFWRLIDKFLSTIFPPSEDEESPVTETSSVTTPPSGAGGAG